MNASWRTIVLNRLIVGNARIRVVADPDGLLLDEDLLQDLENRGLMVLLYDDAWTFRVRYEEDFRTAWDNGQRTKRLLVRATTRDLDVIPFDILNQSDPLYVSVSELFSHLDRHIMAELDPRQYDTAFGVDCLVASGRLNRRDTALRLLRALYAVDPALVTCSEDVWDLISRVHRFAGYGLSTTLAEVLAEILSKWQQDVPGSIQNALTSRHTWELVLRQALNDRKMGWGARYWLGLLGWDTEIGTANMYVSEGLHRKLDDFLHQNHIVGRDWLQRAEDIATMRLAEYRGYEGVEATMLQALDERFDAWVYRDFGLLQSLPPYPDPIMVHHVVNYMARQKEVGKWALLVIDGMSYSDWLYIRSFLDLSSYQVTERALYAWVPSITSVSRKAIFSGRVPRNIRQSLGTTTGEELLWHQFWRQHHRDRETILFQKTADQMNADELLNAIQDASHEMVGLVANTVDLSAHSVTMGTKQLHENLKFWVTENRWLPTIIYGLIHLGFQLVITSDHGHLPVEGIGRPPTGDVPDSKGQRVQVFSSDTLCYQVEAQWGTPWPHLSGLPVDYHPLLAPRNKAYATRGQRLLSHGGVSMEELIVPMIRIRQ